MKSTGISVAMCTYNGSKYLLQQLESLTSQYLQPCEIVISDDFSSDQTVQILEEFASRAGIPIKIYRNNIRTGVVVNYSKAMSYCTGDYIALCDQDDIWLPDKLELTFRKMKEAEEQYGPATPLLVHTDLIIINSAGQKVASSFMNMHKLQPVNNYMLKTLPVQNCVTGCTLLMNRSLLDLALPVAGDAVMHDWWLALLAAASGKLIYLKEPTVLYRKHDENVVGAKSYFCYDNLCKVINYQRMEKDLAAAINQVVAIKERLEQKDLYNNISDLHEFISCFQYGGLKAAKAAYKFGIKKNGLLRTFMLYLILFRGSYRKLIKSK